MKIQLGKKEAALEPNIRTVYVIRSVEKGASKSGKSYIGVQLESALVNVKGEIIVRQGLTYPEYSKATHNIFFGNDWGAQELTDLCTSAVLSRLMPEPDEIEDLFASLELDTDDEDSLWNHLVGAHVAMTLKEIPSKYWRSPDRGDKMDPEAMEIVPKKVNKMFYAPITDEENEALIENFGELRYPKDFASDRTEDGEFDDGDDSDMPF